MPYVYSGPYVYHFSQILQALRLFPALHLLRTLEYKYILSLIKKREAIQGETLFKEISTCCSIDCCQFMDKTISLTQCAMAAKAENRLASEASQYCSAAHS